MFDNEEYWTRTNSGGFDTPSASRLFKCYCDGLSPYTQGFDAHPFRQCTSSVGQLTLPGLENIFEFQNFVPEVHHTSFRTLFVSRGSGDQHPVSDLWTSYPSFLYRTSDSLPWLIKPWKGNLTHHVSDLVPEDHHTSFGTSHRILFPGVSTPFRTL